MFSGKTVVITGASSGLGRALSTAFARERANLVLFSRLPGPLQETAALCSAEGAKTIAVPGDVTRLEDCRALVEAAVGRFGSLDCLVANAGVSMWARFDEVEDPALFRRLMETNYLGAVYCTHYALPHLKESRGAIVAVSSIQGRIAVPYHTGYAASKHALQGFFDTLRTELAGTGVHVLVVLPHWLRGTNLRENAYGKDGRRMAESRRKHSRESVTLDECTARILRALRERRRELVIPGRLRALSWLGLVSPRIVERIVKSKMKDQAR